jgi:DNA polymerase-3 subunit epsilon
MLADQPPLEQVLPGFARFAEDTVLIAHNAAFDMRFLEMARKRTGLAFEQPVLDTLLLSSLIHPGHHHTEHRLEHIASRLGIAVVGRHTALGDAIVTGEVFLKLLPMLAERGIVTLGQAREASRESVYAALAY